MTCKALNLLKALSIRIAFDAHLNIDIIAEIAEALA
jgi:hypothetical protein